MLKKRIIICLDVKDGRTTKGVKFLDNVDIGDPVIMADAYYAQGVDELVFYDIMASAHDRGPTLDLVANVAKTIHIPFCVGGGISTVEDIRATIKAGAEKVSLNSPAVRNPALIREGAAIFGNQCIVLGMDAKRDPAMPSGYRVYINGGRVATELDALEWALRAEELGAGEIVLNSIDADGTRDGYEITVTSLISSRVSIPVFRRLPKYSQPARLTPRSSPRWFTRASTQFRQSRTAWPDRAFPSGARRLLQKTLPVPDKPVAGIR